MMLDELSINSATHEVALAGESIKLTPREFTIVELLARNRGQVLSMEQKEL